MDEQILRNNLIELLRGGQAHLSMEKIIKGINFKHRHVHSKKKSHTIYEIMEHMRIAQEDILQYMLDETWESPPWPEGYWPTNNTTFTEKVWINTTTLFFKDLNELLKFIQDSKIDLTSKIPHGEGRTYLREILLVADHNAYHLGQIMQTRKLLENHSG